jgi:exopolysaccharide biosynthesis predicted pyruvyltransferase EpsI
MSRKRGARPPSFPLRMVDRIDGELSTLLEPARPIALVNFPNHQNPGDNAIWLGAHAALQRLRVPVGYASTWASFSATAMRRAVGDGPLLLNGGGNFGDLYAGQQGLREHVLEHCRERRIIQLPQSIYFRDQANLDRVRRLCAAHPDFILIVRERQSFEVARRWFDVRTLLCPDMAFGLGPLERPAGAGRTMLWLGRQDAERVARTAPPPGLAAADWMSADAGEGMSGATQRILALNRRLIEFTRDDPGRTERRWRALAGTFGPLAEAWVRHGIAVVSSAQIVITDRLHAHIFAILLGVPHVVLDNSYGKVRSTFETWTHESGLSTWAETTEAALLSAATLLRQGSGASKQVQSL